MSYQELPVQMHPKYQEFLEFMKYCPHRKTPECMQTAFWTWLDVIDVAESFQKSNTSKQEKITALKADLDRLHRERDSFQQQGLITLKQLLGTLQQVAA